LSLSGACAVLAYVLGDHLFVANAGDCRAVLGRFGGHNQQWSALALSADHRLDNEKEKQRVVASHPGETDIVKDGRVKGSLMPTRGFGDFAFKLKCLKPVLLKTDSLWNPPYITADPEVAQHKLCLSDKFLVIASDGLWDQFSNEEVVSLIADFAKTKANGDLSNICTYLIEKVLMKAIGDKSELFGPMLQLDTKIRRQYYDDITIIVVFFNTDSLVSNSLERTWIQDDNFAAQSCASLSNKPPTIGPIVNTSAPVHQSQTLEEMESMREMGLAGVASADSKITQVRVS